MSLIEICKMNIKYIDIMPSDIYIEYVNGNFEYISFTKALKIINYCKSINIKFTNAQNAGLNIPPQHHPHLS